MKTRYMIALIAALSISSIALAANDGEVLFNKNKCATCHKMDKKTVGPALRDISAKYVGNGEALAILEKKVREGGVGVWGKMPMPRTPAAVSDDEIKAMVEWMLSHN